MEPLITPEAIEAEARDAGLSMAAVCRRANLADSTFRRWKGGDRSPTLVTIEAMRQAINDLRQQKETA